MPEILTNTDEWLSIIALKLGYIPTPYPLNMFNIKYSLTAAEIATAFTIPVQITPAAAPVGYHYRAIAAAAYYHAGANPFSSQLIYIGDNNNIANAQLASAGALQSNAADVSVILLPGTLAGPAIAAINSNQPLYFMTEADDVAGGNGTIDIYLTYVQEAD